MLRISDYLKSKITHLLIFLSLAGAQHDALSQTFSAEDKTSLEEAKTLNQSAQELLNEANGLFSEIAILENNATKNSKKISRLNNKAIDLQLKALEQQKEANILTYQVYRKQITQKSNSDALEGSLKVKANLLIEQAEKFFYQAEMLRIDAYALKDDQKSERRDKLKEAQEYERIGLEKQQEAYQILYQEPGEENLHSLVSKPGDSLVVINEALLQEYLHYLSSTNETTTLDQLRKVAFSDSVSSVRLRKQWDDYLYNFEKTLAHQESTVPESPDDSADDFALSEKEPKPSEKSESFAENLSETSEKNIYKVQIAADKKPVSQGTLQKIYSSDKKVEVSEKDGWSNYSIGDFDSYAQAEAFKNTLGNENAFVVTLKDTEESTGDKPPVPEEERRVQDKKDTGFLFKVQIAASKNKLNDQELKSIYRGSKKINQSFEDGWYKYSLGEFTDYDEAKTLRKQTGVKDAFIVSSYDGEKIPLYMAVRGIKPKKEQAAPAEKIVFKVQIAADTKPLASSKLHQIYSGYHTIDSYTEDEWYKYAIGELSTFDEANKLRKECKVKGAFIIAFKDGKKINVLEAKKMVRECYTPQIIKDWQEENTRIIFRVQIAASQKELTPIQLKQKFCGEKYIYFSYEKPWYKYAAGNFSGYPEARRMKERIKVAGAFVVAYQYGEKLDIQQAIHKSK
ncbi:MAG: SPOR domain-containing protein [Bacteroidales bacterium]|jgi:hypothetical protein|nr:SPOR domain-containing protein [Bacteroidales bacterium]